MSNSLPKENAILKKLASNPLLTIAYTGHGRREMKKDRIFDADIYRVVVTGQVTWVEWKAEELWHIEGFDIDSRKIRLIVAVYEQQIIIKLITVFTI